MTVNPFRGEVPDDRLYDIHHDVWMRFKGELAEVGITGFGVHLAGEIVAFTAKPAGAQVRRGGGLGTIESAKTVLAVHSPVGLTELFGNEEAEAQPGRLNLDPYGIWMVRGRIVDWPAEKRCLVDAHAYRRHILAIEPDAILS